ncbi:hypothetical protein BU24DRAFT_422914 [Aaosphaeria arxii CBS 175.79]|uniref:Azaphilone pigments biosynthesis cluster protein L N-terminal domain-containing protein n=1 Tax=Aaosphaeria arxii CBS 175.79 TaxID=1450172 RepID=A0A6A5XWE1_9PLEO|nr:uncharacterized protein BU24DRAFT_422914 [Aaosphaeria arxii CBS 175.79]KAF2016554.1 hypothetical protein BU24DRAFT_422914 [Aaosphaeria arxii CBS 175.79]
MDPLSIPASIAGVTMATLKSVQLLVQTIENIREAPVIVLSISNDLRTIQPVLQSLAGAMQNNSSQIVLNEQIQFAVKNCKKGCNAFQLQVEHWMRRSTGDKMFWVDRWKVALFGLERINTFKGQLSAYKATLSVALSTATIITTARQENLMKELRDMMLRQNEVVIREQVVQADAEANEIQSTIEQLTVGTSSKLSLKAQSSAELEHSRQEVFQELGRQQDANNILRELCEEALSQTVHERTGQKIKGVYATNNSSALAGFINTSEQESRIDQDISDVVADNWSLAVAGVVKNIDFKDFAPCAPGRSGI